MKKKLMIVLALSMSILLSSCSTINDKVNEVSSEVSGKTNSSSAEVDEKYESFHKYVDLSNYINDVYNCSTYFESAYDPTLGYDFYFTPFDTTAIEDIGKEVEAEEYYKDLSKIALDFYPHIIEFTEKGYDLTEYISSGEFNKDGGKKGEELFNELSALNDKIVAVDDKFYPLYTKDYKEYNLAYIDLYKEKELYLSYNTSLFNTVVDEFTDYLYDNNFDTDNITEVDYKDVKHFKEDIDLYYEDAMKYYDEKTVAKEGFSEAFYTDGKDVFNDVYNDVVVMFDAIENKKPFEGLTEDQKYETPGTSEKLSNDFSIFIYYFNY